MTSTERSQIYIKPQVWFCKVHVFLKMDWSLSVDLYVQVSTSTCTFLYTIVISLYHLPGKLSNCIWYLYTWKIVQVTKVYLVRECKAGNDLDNQRLNLPHYKSPVCLSVCSSLHLLSLTLGSLHLLMNQGLVSFGLGSSICNAHAWLYKASFLILLRKEQLLLCKLVRLRSIWFFI